MELVLALHEETYLHVTCNDQYSHTTDLQLLLFQNEDEKTRSILDDPVAYGKRLYTALFPPDSIAQQALASMPERLLIVASEPLLDAIPWEYVYGPYGTDDPTASDYSENCLVLECPFVRGLPKSQRIPPPPLHQSLHIVAIPSNPLSNAIEPLAIEAEWTRLKESIQQMPSAITLERSNPPTLERVRQLVANQKGRVVHFMGHGGQDQQQGAVLCFEQHNGALHLVTAKEFVQRVRGTIFLVTLNACVSATPGPTPFSNLASALVRQKTPYALGMRLSILDEDARTFSRVFYNELARGVPVEEALFQSRLTLAQSRRSWVIGVPVLYTSLTDSAPGFVSHDGIPGVKENRPHIDVSVLPPVEGTFHGRINDLIALGTDLTGDQRPRIMTILGSGGQGKTALALKAVERFAFAWSGGVWTTTFENLPNRSTFVIALAQFLEIETQDTLDITNIERLILARLNQRRTLLVLDNAETLVEAVEAKNNDALDLVAFLKKLLGTLACLLITSRIPLGWDDEKTYELGGLSPKEGAALFRQGAPQRRGEIDIVGAESLSSQLEGHPLGLRLLAGAFNGIHLSLPMFLQTTEERLLEAENKYIGLEHRHRKLYACIETSVRLLDPALHALLSGLWIFHAPFFADAAVAIFDPDVQETEMHSSPVRDQLSQLWRRSLLTRKTVATREGTLQFYALLPTTRPYVEHHLEQRYDRELLKRRFVTVYAQIVRYAYAAVHFSTILAREVREDLEWVCDTLENVEMAVAERGRYLLYWGQVVYRLGNSLRGLSLLERALELLQGIDASLTFTAFNHLAKAYSDTGRPQEALKLYEEALPIIREVGDRNGEAQTLGNIAEVYRITGRSQEALKLYEEVLPIMREVSNRTGEATILNNMALASHTIGYSQEALKLFEETLAIRREMDDRVEEATTLNNMAAVYAVIGSSQEALQLFEEALLITREMGYRIGEATTLNNIAEVYRDTERFQEALQLFEEVLPMRREVGDRAGEAATLNNIALVSKAIGHPQEALQLYEKVLLITREVSDRLGEATTLNNIASAYDSMGQPQKALQFYEEALPIKREVGDRIGEATIFNDLAHLYQSLQRYSDAVTAFEQSIDLQQQFALYAEEIVSLVSLALLLYRHLNRPVDAIPLLEQAIHIFAEKNLSKDKFGFIIEDAQKLLVMIRNETSSNTSSILPIEMIQQIVSTTIAVMTVASSHHQEWIEQITSILQDAQQRGADWQQEYDFFMEVLAILRGQPPVLPQDHCYAPAIEAIQQGIAPTGEETA